MPKDVRAQLNALHRKAGELYSRHFLFCYEQVNKEIPAFLKEDTFQIVTACTLIATIRGAILEEAIRQGYLTYDNQDPDRMLGAFLTI